MNYVDNGALIDAFDDYVASVTARLATITSGTTVCVVDAGAVSSNTLLSSMSLDSDTSAGVTLLTVESPEAVSNEQAPTITVDTPTITVDTPTIVEPTLEVIEGAGEGTVESNEDLEVPGTVEETVEDAGDGADPEQEESPEDKIASDEDEV